MPTTRTALTAAVAGLAAPVLALWVGSSAAASCRGMTIAYSVTGGQLVVLQPAHVDIAYRGCVQFTNDTAATATVVVGGSYSEQVAPNSSTSDSRNYVGTAPGRQPVTATSGSASTPGSTAHGSVTVAAKPARSSPPAHPSGRPGPSHSATPVPTTPAPSTSSSGPQVAPTPSSPRRRTASASPGPGGVIEPPVTPAGPIQLTPTVSPSPAVTAVVSGPVEPASGRGIGLPAAIAAVAVLGSGTALVRVIAAEAVDDGETVARSS